MQTLGGAVVNKLKKRRYSDKIQKIYIVAGETARSLFKEKRMKKLFKMIAPMLAVCIMAISTGCTQNEVVAHNIRKEADFFNVARRIVVVNIRTDKPIFELKGYFALSNNGTNELVVTCETGQNQYQMHYVYLNDWTMYVVEQLDSSTVDKYHYEIWYMPEAIIPTIKPTD